MTTLLTTVSGSFGELLRQLRETRELSQAALSRLTFLDPSYISRLEAGRRQPSRDVVGILATALRLEAQERSRFFAAAGYLTLEPESDSDPTISRLRWFFEQNVESATYVRRTIDSLLDFAVSLERAR